MPGYWPSKIRRTVHLSYFVHGASHKCFKRFYSYFILFLLTSISPGHCLPKSEGHSHVQYTCLISFVVPVINALCMFLVTFTFVLLLLDSISPSQIRRECPSTGLPKLEGQYSYFILFMAPVIHSSCMCTERSK